MRWELCPPTRMAMRSIEDWDLYVENDGELDVVGFVSHMKDGGWRSFPLVGVTNESMHLTKEEAMEACVAELVKWRMQE